MAGLPAGYDEYQANMKAQLKKVQATLKDAKKNNVPTKAFINPACIAHLNAEEMAHFHAVLYPALTDAHNGWLTRPGSNVRNLHMHKEKILAVLYETMLEEEDAFFRLFENPAIEVWPERCSGMIGTYATILRQRGEYARCTAVMRLYTRVIERYEAMTKLTAPSKDVIERAATKQCLDGLYYKYLLIKFNLLRNLDPACESVDLKELGRDFRRVSAYEISTGIVARDGDNFAFMLQPKPITLSSLKSMTNARLGVLYRGVMRTHVCSDTNSAKKVRKSMDKKEARAKKKVALHQCAMCYKTEEFLNDFRKCARCSRKWYCSRDCQCNHWKHGHKQLCKKKDDGDVASGASGGGGACGAGDGGGQPADGASTAAADGAAVGADGGAADGAKKKKKKKRRRKKKKKKKAGGGDGGDGGGGASGAAGGGAGQCSDPGDVRI